MYSDKIKCSPCLVALQRVQENVQLILTLGKVVMGRKNPKQGHELKTETPEHDQGGPTEIVTYKKQRQNQASSLQHYQAILYSKHLNGYKVKHVKMINLRNQLAYCAP